MPAFFKIRLGGNAYFNPAFHTISYFEAEGEGGGRNIGSREWETGKEEGNISRGTGRGLADSNEYIQYF